MITDTTLVQEFIKERERFMQTKIISINSMHDRRDSYIVESTDRLLDKETNIEDDPMPMPVPPAIAIVQNEQVLENVDLPYGRYPLNVEITKWEKRDHVNHVEYKILITYQEGLEKVDWAVFKRYSEFTSL